MRLPSPLQILFFSLAAALAGAIYLAPSYFINAAIMDVINSSMFGNRYEADTGYFDPTPATETAANDGTAPGELWASPRNRNHIATIFNTAMFSKLRTVSTDQVLTVDDLLQPGEARPDRALETLWMTARAPDYMMQHCTLALATHARSCAFESQDIDRRDDGTYRVKTSLATLPAYDLGTAATNVKYRLEDERFTLPRKRDATSGLPADKVQEASLALFKLASEECAALHAAKGNCIISNINLRVSANRRQPDTMDVLADVTLSWLRSADQLDDVALRKESAIDSDTSLSGFAALKAKAAAMLGGGDASEADTNKVKILRGGGALKTGGSALNKAGKADGFIKAPSSE